MTVQSRLPLKAQIALLAIVIAVATAIAASVVPSVVFDLRNAVFETSLSAADRAALRDVEQTVGVCSPAYQELRDALGFAAWRLNYDFVLAGVVALVAALMAGLSWALAARLAAPIEWLARAARTVASGARTSSPAVAPRSTEVAALMADFASMTEALRAADEDLSMRTAAIAHDIRTPLTVLRGRLTGLRENVFVADASFVNGLIEQIGWIDHLVTDLNALSDARQAGVSARERLDFGALVRDCVVALQPEIAGVAITLETDIAPNVVIDADPGRMRRVVVNILKNLIRYAPNAQARLSLRAEAGRAVLVCADEGPGWPDGDPTALTEAFVRGEASRSRATGGSGLGLSIVQATVSAYGGTTTLTRGEAGGAVITVHVPLSA